MITQLVSAHPTGRPLRNVWFRRWRPRRRCLLCMRGFIVKTGIAVLCLAASALKSPLPRAFAGPAPRLGQKNSGVSSASFARPNTVPPRLGRLARMSNVVVDPITPVSKSSTSAEGRLRACYFAHAEYLQLGTPLLKRDAVRGFLECAETLFPQRHWNLNALVGHVSGEFASGEGMTYDRFEKLVSDVVRFGAKSSAYATAFDSLAIPGVDVITRHRIEQLFASLGRPVSTAELDRLVDEADVGKDGIDFVDFLFFSRRHLRFDDVLKHLRGNAQAKSEPPEFAVSKDSDAGVHLGKVTTVHGEEELNHIVRNFNDVIVKVTFTWCRPCRIFWPAYQKYAAIYGGTKFLKIVGNENDSSQHYAREVLNVKASPVFATYSQGELIDTWHGANADRFKKRLETSFATQSAVDATAAWSYGSDEFLG